MYIDLYTHTVIPPSPIPTRLCAQCFPSTTREWRTANNSNSDMCLYIYRCACISSLRIQRLRVNLNPTVNCTRHARRQSPPSPGPALRSLSSLSLSATINPGIQNRPDNDM